MVSAATTRGAEDEGGVVAAVAKLAGCVESESEGERYGESEADEGECESGVVDSDVAFGGGRCTCEGGRGMATLGEARTGWVPTPPAIGGATEVEGDEALEDERRCVGWKYGSCADNPIRLSTGSPNRRLCWINSSLYISLSRDIRMNSRSVSTRRLRSCSFSRRMASSMSSELGAIGLGRRRRVGDCVPSPLTLVVPPSPPGDPPFCCWLASCCASRESSRERRFTCDSDSASSAFSSSIFSSWS